MERIGDDLRQALHGLGPAGAMQDVVRVWPEAVGEAIARNAWPARLARDGTLHVAAGSSPWAFELTHLEPTIRARLVEKLGDAAPARLRFAPGRLPEPGGDPTDTARPVPPEPGPAARARAAELAAAIEDERLRELVARAAAASLAEGGADRVL